MAALDARLRHEEEESPAQGHIGTHSECHTWPRSVPPLVTRGGVPSPAAARVRIRAESVGARRRRIELLRQHGGPVLHMARLMPIGENGRLLEKTWDPRLSAMHLSASRRQATSMFDYSGENPYFTSRRSSPRSRRPKQRAVPGPACPAGENAHELLDGARFGLVFVMRGLRNTRACITPSQKRR
jgi:hypothetical protein